MGQTQVKPVIISVIVILVVTVLPWCLGEWVLLTIRFSMSVSVMYAKGTTATVQKKNSGWLARAN